MQLTGCATLAIADLVGVAVEDVEREAGQQRVAHGGVLTECVRGGPRCRACTRRPTRPRPASRGGYVELAHGLPMPGDERRPSVGVAEQLVVLVGGELTAGPLPASSRSWCRLRFQRSSGRESPEVPPSGLPSQLREEAPGPVEVVAVGAGGDEAQLLSKHGTQAVYRRNSAAYSSGVRLPPQPQGSLPTPQRRRSSGSRSPFASRVAAIAGRRRRASCSTRSTGRSRAPAGCGGWQRGRLQPRAGRSA